MIKKNLEKRNEVEVEEPSWWAVQEDEIRNESSEDDEGKEDAEETEEYSSSEDTEFEEEDGEEKEPTPDFIFRLIRDSWQGPNLKCQIYHLNKTGRKHKIDPRKEERPVPISQLYGRRIKVKTKCGKSVRGEVDWKHEEEKPEGMDRTHRFLCEALSWRSDRRNKKTRVSQGKNNLGILL